MAGLLNYVGGSEGFDNLAGNNGNGDYVRLNFFEDRDISVVFPNKDSRDTGYILPSFDYSIPREDARFRTSFTSYRTGTQSPKTGLLEFSNWLIPLPGYIFFGKSYSHFISPTVNREYDPLNALYEYCRELSRTNSDHPWAKLILRSANAAAVIPNKTTLSFFNAWCAPTDKKAKDQSVRNRILVLKPMAARKLMDDLNTLRPAAIGSPVDPKWPNFKYGDLTNPAGALMWTTMAFAMPGNEKVVSAALSLGTERMDGMGNITVDVQRLQVTNEMLAGRIDIFKSIYVPTAQEIADVILDDGAIPVELLEKVCGDHITIPKSAHTKSKTYPAVAPTSTPTATLAPVAAQETPVAPYAASTPTPVATTASPFSQDDRIPGIDDQPPTFASAPAPSAGGMTQEELAEIAKLQGLISSMKATTSDIERYSTLMQKQAGTIK